MTRKYNLYQWRKNDTVITFRENFTAVGRYGDRLSVSEAWGAKG
jgi:hypothetical protein